jgi:HEPN domain-containing protein
MIDPANLAKKNIKKVLRRNQKKYGRTQGANTLLEKIEIEKHQKEMGVEFLNSIEKALFGEFNNAQYPDFPTVRIKKSDWIELVCFKAKLGNDQMH